MFNISNIRVNFNSPDILPDGNIFGKTGEHNATVLDITPPDYMSAKENIVLYCLAFETGCDFIRKIIRSEMIPKADVIHIPLWGQVTVSENVRFQLEGYDGENNLLVKSTVVEGVFLPSVNGVQSPSDFGNNGMSATVAANTFARHTHENSEVLNKFGEDADGNLIYKGREIGSSRPTEQLEVFMEEETDLNIWTDTYGQFGRVFMVDLASRIPVGTEIASVEIAFLPDENTGEHINNGEYINIKDMYTFDTSPYVILTDKVLYNPDFECLTYAYLLCFSPEFTPLLTKAIDYGWSKIRITYYTD